MRRRDRMEGHIWLDWVESEANRKQRTLALEFYMSIGDSMHRLVREFCLMVVAEQESDRFYIRCYPRLGALANGLPYFAACYGGHDLADCLCAALYEYDKMAEGLSAFNLTNSEVCRWIT